MGESIPNMTLSSPGLKVKMIPIDSIKENPENRRLHPGRNIEAIKRSLARFGQREPLLVRDGIVLGGNGRLRAMLELGWMEALVTDHSDLTEEQARALGLALNRTAELAEWHWQGLAEDLRKLLGEGYEAQDLGWEDYEIEPLLAADWSPPAVINDPDQNPPPVPEGNRGSEGEPWVVMLSAEQKEVVEAALATTMGAEDEGMTRGEALVRICEAI